MPKEGSFQDGECEEVTDGDWSTPLVEICERGVVFSSGLECLRLARAHWENWLGWIPDDAFLGHWPNELYPWEVTRLSGRDQLLVAHPPWLAGAEKVDHEEVLTLLASRESADVEKGLGHLLLLREPQMRQVLPKVLTLLAEEKQVGWTVLWALRERGGPEVEAAMISLLGDDRLAAKAGCILQQVGGERSIPALVRYQEPGMLSRALIAVAARARCRVFPDHIVRWGSAERVPFEELERPPGPTAD